MVGVFRRTLSFPNKQSHNNKPHLSHHIRSISLPCRSHPLISHIKDEIKNLTNTTTLSSSNLSQCLNRLKDLHDALHHILQLTQTQESLRRHPVFFQKLLEDFLRFIEVYGMFQTSILSFKEELSAVQVGIRKRDRTKVVLYVKAKKKMVKEMKKLMSCIRYVVTQHDIMFKVPMFGDAELVRIIEDVINVTVSISVGLFNRITVLFASKKLTWTQIVKLSRTKKRMKNDEEIVEELEKQDDGVEGFVENVKKIGIEEMRSVLKRVKDLEECICGIEIVSHKVLRAFINSRVALLNTLSQ
ncbi:hypothetical protein Lal_00034906 [Lupinus albus]|uniref:Uncharacterized protein n=1 Tax=Lupinus albus TaxID=3870 RepID=A0A6A5PIQ7_LUPAL|nr:hypothetical protein Lalb_Chr03g0033641 [Lupinus albus]KAF1897203.1 hypothetical protein Lal_00034906 [Lupinus albus]